MIFQRRIRDFIIVYVALIYFYSQRSEYLELVIKSEQQYPLRMAAIYNRLFQRCIHLQIRGVINEKTAIFVYNSLNSCNRFNVEAIFVSINSPNGSLTQAKNIADAVKHFARRKTSPVYCFAEDACLGSANLIFTSGLKCFANKTSMLGDFGYTWRGLDLTKFADKFNVRMQYVYAGKQKVGGDMFKELAPETKQFLQNHVYNMEHELKVEVIKNRAEVFDYLKLTKEDIDKNVLSAGLILPEQAVKYGYIDGIKTVDEFVKERYDGIKIHNIQKSDFKHWIKSHMITDVIDGSS